MRLSNSCSAGVEGADREHISAAVYRRFTAYTDAGPAVTGAQPGIAADRFARKIVGILAFSHAARLRRLMRNPLGGIVILGLNPNHLFAASGTHVFNTEKIW